MIIVDREPGQYLGHPTTVLLEDGQTLLCVYPKGHGKGAIQFKRSHDGGRTWSPRLPTPENWATSVEVPTIHRVADAAGKKRLILWSGLHPARLSVSEDDGATWSPLMPAGDWGGIVAMSALAPVRAQPGHYLAWFHDDGRFFRADSKPENPLVFRLYQTASRDGGLTWSQPRELFASATLLLCEPGVIRSPDGRQLALLLREESREHESQIIFSDDEGATWSTPRPLHPALRGDRHTIQRTPDGRLFISFRDTHRQSPTQGDWCGWVGHYDDLVHARPGDYRLRLLDNTKGWDCGYAGVEVQPDGTIIATSYGHWTEGEPAYIVCLRFTLAELDARRAAEFTRRGQLPPVVEHNPTLHRYEATIDGHLAIAEYELAGDRVILTHTFVPPELRGRGVAEALVRTALDTARAGGRRVVPQCSYVARFIARHSEYQSLLAP